jgi:YVTN family beta-propeller protein
VWVGTTASEDVYRIDPRTNAVASLRLGGTRHAWLATSTRDVWVSNGLDGTVTRIAAATRKVVATVKVGDLPVDGAVAPNGLVWIPNKSDSTISIVDPARNAVVRTIRSGPGPFVVGVAFGDMWVPSYGGDDVWRYDLG